jgi:PAS domain S-box-containing protein
MSPHTTDHRDADRVEPAGLAPGSARDMARDADAELAWLLVESSPDGVVVTDREGVITLVNRQVEDLFGYGRAELVGQPVEVLLPAAARRVHTAHRLRHVARPRVRAMGADQDLWALRRDGAEFPVEVSLSPCVQGGEERVIATVRDVSARRAAEQRMRNLSHMLDGIIEAVYLIDPDTLTFTYVNEAACAQTGYDRAELLEMGPVHLLPGLAENQIRGQVASLVGGGDGPSAETAVLRRGDGVELMVEWQINLSPPLRGQPLELVAIVRDISSRLAEAARAQAAQGLLALVDDRARIARDLHDTVIQDLFATGLALQSVAMRVDPDIRARIDKLIDRQDDAIREIRTTIFGLTARRGNADSLCDQARAVVDEAARVLGFHPSFRVSGPVDTVASTEITGQLIPALRETSPTSSDTPTPPASTSTSPRQIRP